MNIPLKHKPGWCECYTPNQPFLHFLFCHVRQVLLCGVVGLSGILNWTRHSHLHLHCVSRATAFPFRGWQYPSFLFISRLSGRRKWITELSRRGTGAITGVWEKRNFDMWGLLTLYPSRTLGVCYGTPHCSTLAAKANRPAGVISSAHLFLPGLRLPLSLSLFGMLYLSFSFTGCLSCVTFI